MDALRYGLSYVNEALTDLGQTDLLTGLDTSASDPRERRCAIAYEKARLAVLTQVEWNFARATAPAASYPTEEHERGGFGTPLPGDCLRLLSATDAYGEEPLREVIGDTIFSAVPLDRLEYLRDIPDPRRWGSKAQCLLVVALAAAYAKIVKGSFNELQMREQLYTKALKEARIENARENRRPKQHVGGNYYVDVMRGTARRKW